MLKRNLFQRRQLAGIDALAAILASALSSPPLAVTAHQLVGTGMTELQAALAITAAAAGQRCLVAQPDYLHSSVEHFIRRVTQLGRGVTAGGAPAAARCQVVAATARDILTAVDSEALQPGDFGVLVVNGANEREPHDFRPVVSYFSAARLVATWATAKHGAAFPTSAVAAGVITIVTHNAKEQPARARGGTEPTRHADRQDSSHARAGGGGAD